MCIKIIPLTPDRMNEYRALRIEALTVDYVAFGGMTPENDIFISDKKLLKETSENRLKKVFLAEVDKKIVGMIIVKKYSLLRNRAWLRLFFVSPTMRGKKIGYELLKSAIEHTKERGVPSVYLAVIKTQETAIRIYEEFKFKKIKEGIGRIKVNGEFQKYNIMRLLI